MVTRIIILLSITFVFSNTVLVALANITGVHTYDLYFLNSYVDSGYRTAIMHYGTLYLVLPLLALVYAAIIRQLRLIGYNSIPRPTTKDK
jgi:ABC-type antimicrobial peptide transport system permease subunit